MATALLDGIRAHYEQIGSGPDVVMVHGLGANLAFWALRIAPMLSHQARITSYDLRGHGYSETTPSGYAPSDLAADLDALLDAIGVDAVHLVGHSYGADVALAYSLVRPARVRSLVLADPALLAGRLAPEDGRQALIPRPPLGDSRPSEDVVSTEEAVGLFPRHPIGSPRFATPFTLWDRAGRGAASWRTLVDSTSLLADVAGAEPITPARLRRVHVPVLMTYGEHSRFRASAPLLRAGLPSSRLVTVPGTGHFHPLVKPGVTAREIERFLVTRNGFRHRSAPW